MYKSAYYIYIHKNIKYMCINILDYIWNYTLKIIFIALILKKMYKEKVLSDQKYK